MYTLEHLDRGRILSIFRWYWLIEARLFSELCLVLGHDAERLLGRSVNEHTHRAYTQLRSRLAEALEGKNDASAAIPLVEERHRSLVSLLGAASKILDARALHLIELAGAGVGEDLGREHRCRLGLAAGAEGGSSGALGECMPTRMRAGSLDEEKLLAQSFIAGFQRAWAENPDAHMGEGIEQDPVQYLHFRTAFPCDPVIADGPYRRNDG